MNQVIIYCIEDCDGLKYVGSTKNILNQRLSEHKTDKKRNRGCSSEKLNLNICKIYSLELCDECDRKEREKYYINQIDCVNKMRYDFDRKENSKEWYQNNKEKKKEYYKNNKEKNNKYYQKNKDEINLFRRKKVVNGCYEFIKMLEEY